MATQRASALPTLPKRATKPPKAAEWAERIFNHIPALGEAPKSGEQLAADAGLKVTQIQKAIGYLRDTYPEFPLISSPDGYHFTMDADAVNAFRRARMKSALTTIRRTWEGAVKPYLDHINDEVVSLTVRKQYERLFEDVSDLVR
jgi:hypothetical protein